MSELNVITFVILSLAFAAGLATGCVLLYRPLENGKKTSGYTASSAFDVGELCFADGCVVARILLCHGREVATAGRRAYRLYFNEDDSHPPSGNG